MIFNRQDIRNVVVLVIAQAITACIGIVTFFRFAAVLPVSEVGRLSFVIASTLFFGLLGEMGIRYVVMGEIALNPAQARVLFRHSFVIRCMLSLSSLVLLLLFTAVIQPWQAERSLLLLAAVVAVTTFASDPAIWVLYGRGRGDLAGVLLVIDRLLYFGAVLVAANTFKNADSVILAELVTNLLRAVISWFWVRPFLVESDNSRWEFLLFKRLLATSAAQGLALIAYVTYSQLSVVLVQSGTTEQALGYYSFAFNAVALLLFVPIALLTALYPTLARSSKYGVITEETHRHVAGLVLVLLLPLAVGLFLFADQAITILIAGRYAPSILMVRILALSTIASALRFMYRQFLFALNKPLPSTLIDVIGVVLLVGAGIPVVKVYGGLGMAVLFTSLEFVLVVMVMLVARQWVGLPRYLFLLVRGVVACLLPGVLAFALSEQFFVRLVVYGLGVIGSMLVFQIITLGQVREIQDAVLRTYQRVFSRSQGVKRDTITF